MEQRVIIPRIIVVRNIMAVYSITPDEVGQNAYVSNSVVSKYINGKRESYEVSKFFIKEVFNMEVKEFDIVKK